MNTIIAGIDLGTQSLKVILYDASGHTIVAAAQEPLDLITGPDGTSEQKTAWYDAALHTCFAALPPADRARIAAIGVSGQQHGFVPLDAQGQALHPVKLWNDTSTAEECRIITEHAGGDAAVVAAVQNLMLPGFTAPKILWLKRHHPDAFARLQYVMLPHTYLNWLLTGAYGIEAGDASGTALFTATGSSNALGSSNAISGSTNQGGAPNRGDSAANRSPVNGAWVKTLCDCIDPGLYALLPPISAPTAAAGMVTPAAAARFGIPAGIPVAAGGGDNMMAAIGTGTVRDGVLTLSLGTSGTLFGYSDTPVADPAAGISGFCASTGGYLPLLCTMNCTVASEKTRALFGPGVTVNTFDALAARAPAGAEGVVFLPFFSGERTPNLPAGRATLCNMTAATCRQENIARAALESALFGIRSGLDAFKRLGFHPREIRITGGGAKSPLWRQLAADILNCPVQRPQETESAAFGAALQALWYLNQNAGTGVSTPQEGIAAICDEHVRFHGDPATPDLATVAVYDHAYAVYTRYLDALSPLFR